MDRDVDLGKFLYAFEYGHTFTLSLSEFFTLSKKSYCLFSTYWGQLLL